MRFHPEPPPQGIVQDLREYLNRMFRDVSNALYSPDPQWEPLDVDPGHTGNGTAEPPWKVLVGGVECRHFEDGPSDEVLHYRIRYPNSGKTQANQVLRPTLNIAARTNDSGTAQFCTEYTWANLSGSFSSSVTLTANFQTTAQMVNQIVEFDPQTIPAEIGTVVLARLYRDVSDDNFSGDIAMVSIDWNIQRIGTGSDLEYRKRTGR